MMKETIRPCIDYIKQLNIYTAKDEDTVEERRNQFVATRLFLVLFVISLIGLVGYASLTRRLTNVQIPNPSQSAFEKLYSLYSQTLLCPCSQTSIQISKFVQSHVFYHQVRFPHFSFDKHSIPLFLFSKCRFVRVYLLMINGYHQSQIQYPIHFIHLIVAECYHHNYN